METKLDSRQGQFPATFPDTFKDFFAMMSEDEDHVDLFSSLLEDKVIPRANRLSQRRTGGSLRCTSSSSSSSHGHGRSAGGRNAGGDDGYSQQHNVGRSNSFRMNRPRNVFTSSATALNHMGVGSGNSSNTGSPMVTAGNSRSGSSGSLFCKHIKYCCLHQQQTQQHQQQQHQQQRQTHKSSNQKLFQGGATSTIQQQQQPHSCYHDYDYMSTRLGPDGEDNTERNVITIVDSSGSGSGTSGGAASHHTTSHYQQQQQQAAIQLAHLQKRHSVILERAFDFDASCDESDTISTTSSTPTACNIPYNILKPILKQPQQQQHQHFQQQQQQQQQHSSLTMASKTMPKEKTHSTGLPAQQTQHQHQSLPQPPSTVVAAATTTTTVPTHRTLPQPPKGSSGAYHTRETALQRVQQQSRFFAGSKTNLSAVLTGQTQAQSQAQTSANNITGSGNGGGFSGVGNTGNNASEGLNNNNHYNSSSGSGSGSGGGGSGGVGHTSSSNYNLQETMSVLTASGRSMNYIEMQSPTTNTTTVQLPGATTMGKFNNEFLSSVGGTGGGADSASHCAAVDCGATNLIGSGAGSGTDMLGSASRSNLNNIRAQKSPILNRRRSSSIAATLLTADIGYNWGNMCDNDDISNMRGCTTGTIPHSGARDRINIAKSPISSKPTRMPLIPVESGVLTFQQAISGAVSPQYAGTSQLIHTCGTIVSGSAATGLDMMCGSTTALASVLEDASATAEHTINTNLPYAAESPTNNGGGGGGGGGGIETDLPTANATATTAITNNKYSMNMGATTYNNGGKSGALHGSTATIAQLGNKQRQRMRTSSMPAESRKPRLAETRRAAIHCADIDLEYYRLRSFSITSHGVCNLGDSLRSRRSRSINSVTSTGTSNSGKDRNNSNASRTSGDIIFEQVDKRDPKGQVPAYKIAMLGASGVGKTTLTYQFTTSEYICAYDLSLDDDYGQKTVSVLVDGIETDLEIIDHPACEMSTEAFCSTYNIDLFVVVYSVVDRNSFKAAEKVLQYLKENEMLLTRGAILVGNKTDLERHREVNTQMGRKLAKDIACKFIETSSGLNHNVDELLVGVVAQVKLNPQRIRNLSERDRQRLNLQSTIQKHRHMHMPPRRMVRQVSMCHADDEDSTADHSTRHDERERGGKLSGGNEVEERDENQSNNIMSIGDEGIGTGSERTASTSLSSSASKSIASFLAGGHGAPPTKGPIRKTNKRTLNLESILKMGESEVEEEEEMQRQFASRPLSKFELLAAGMKNTKTSFANSVNSLPKSRHRYETTGGGGGASGDGAGGVISRHRSGSQLEMKLLDEDCNRKTVSKLTNRTKVFLSSVLRFKKAINVKRRNSSSCSDLFVI